MASSSTGEGSALSSGIPRHAFLGISIVFILLTAAFVAIRLFADAKNLRKLLPEDYIAVFAVVLFGATFGLDDEIVKALRNPTTTIVTLAKYGVAVDVLSGFSLVASKTPILLLYIRLFGVKKWLKVCSYLTLAVLSVLMLACTIAIGVVCAPHGDVLPTSHLLRCSNWSAHNGIASGTLSIVVDIVILIIPIPVIIGLQLPTSKKIGLAVVFTTGLFAIGASAVSLRFKVDSLSGTSTDTSTAIFFTNLEWCIAVMVGCVPAIYSFWSSVVVSSTLYSKISTAFSAISLTASTNRSNRSKQSQSSRRHNFHPGGNSTDNMVDSNEWEDGNLLKGSFSRQGHGGTTIVPLQDVTIPRL
ncbi:hypothetical protein F4818DRAFT_405212 [Hypoxylon cercidicola]|nr:hypothetical protein F4818DRAFT_405212 [Hypoxylon cercidicola]